MIELADDTLTASFPDMPETVKLTIEFQRTLRIPDDDKTYPLPPGFGPFPLRHIDDYAKAVPKQWLERGGVILPMWQSEALWIGFSGWTMLNRETKYPFAVKVATGKISAITGSPWKPGLTRNPQDYLVTPEQRWLDGYCVEEGVIRQFVAMPMGKGYSVEEQLTRKTECGGIQIEVVPLRWDVFEKRFPVQPPPDFSDRERLLSDRESLLRLKKFEHYMPGGPMELAPGGRMTQEVYEDAFNLEDWDTDKGSRCFVHLLNAATWCKVTGEAPPSEPLTPRAYAAAGYPWFSYYASDKETLRGSKTLASLKTVSELAKEKNQPLEENDSVFISNLKTLAERYKKRRVREGDLT